MKKETVNDKEVQNVNGGDGNDPTYVVYCGNCGYVDRETYDINAAAERAGLLNFSERPCPDCGQLPPWLWKVRVK